MSLLLRNMLAMRLVPQRSYSEVVNVFGRKTVDTAAANTSEDKSVARRHHEQIPESVERVRVLSAHPTEHVEDRVAKIYVTSKNAMQSGTYGLRRWKIEFDNRDRWENPLMGWGSSGDPMSSLQLEFSDKQDAIAYCDRMGLKYEVSEPQKIKPKIKSYGANFSWNKKTRRSTK